MDLCTLGALKEMIAPSLLAVIVPLVTGFLLSAEGVVGLLCGVTVTGFVMASLCFMANAGGAWDNAKKYIEGGQHGGKSSDCHKAAVIGDTVGDPFKDTSGPSLNILIKLCSTVSIVFSTLIVHFTCSKKFANRKRHGHGVMIPPLPCLLKRSILLIKNSSSSLVLLRLFNNCFILLTSFKHFKQPQM